MSQSPVKLNRRKASVAVVLLAAAATFAATSGGPAFAQAEADRAPAQTPGQAPDQAGQAPDQADQTPGQASQAPDQADPPQAPAQDQASAQASDSEKPYMVECGPDPEGGGNVCFVDRDTYVGWRTFHSACHTCHAQDAVGSTFAPDLLQRMRVIDKAQFMKSLDEGYQGQVGVMPAWGGNPNVNKYYEELWSYLRARADGELLPGRPKRRRGSE